MALAGTGSTSWEAEKAAAEAARDSYMADKQDRVLTVEEIQELIDAMETAKRNALFAHIVAAATVQVTSVSGVTTGVSVSGPGVGSLL